MIAESQWNSERIVSLKPSESVSVRGYDVTLDSMMPRPGPNYRELVARFTVRRDGEVIDVLDGPRVDLLTRIGHDAGQA